MSILSPDDKDITRIQTATSKVIADAIDQVAAVLLPAITDAVKRSATGITITVGPITIEPIKITIGNE